MSYSDEVLADAPYSYWHLDEASGSTAVDAMGHANLTYNGCTLGQPALAGTGTCINTGTVGFLTGSQPHVDGLTTWTWECWVRVDTVVEFASIISDHSNATRLVDVQTLLSGLLRLHYRDASNVMNIVDATGGNVNDGDVHHIVTRMDGTSFTLWVDAVQVGSGTRTASTAVNSVTFQIGRDALSASSLNFRGAIDEVAFYNTALSDARILAHFNAGGPGPSNITPPVVTGTAVVGETLTTTDGTWDDVDTVAYQWWRDGEDIVGETANTYDLVTADVGHAVSVNVTATNVDGSQSIESNAKTPVAEIVGTDLQMFTSATGVGGTPAVHVTNPGAVFDWVTAPEAVSGDVEYRAIYIKNVHPVRTVNTVVVWISAQTPSPSTDLAVGIAPEAAGSSVTSVANESTAPASVTFSAPPNAGAGLSIGTLTPGQSRGVWLRRTVTAGAAELSIDDATVNWQGTPA